MSETRVVNMRHEPHDVRIDRRTMWGNPFRIGPDGTREEVIDKYREWVLTQPMLMSHLNWLKGKRLGCWCKPLACHGDVLVELIDKIGRDAQHEEMRSMKRRFWKHQLIAFGYARRRRHPALFMEMRLGKNLVTIRTVMLYKPLDPNRGLRVLIVAPRSAFAGWKHDLTLEGQGNDIAWLVGSRKERLEVLHNKTARWNIINKEGYISIPEIANLRIVNWDAVILDESTFIKNPKARVTRFFVNRFRDCPHRWILTGTPNPESDMEFWTQLSFLNGHFLQCRNFWDFRAKYFEPEPGGYGWTPKPGMSKIIQEAVGAQALIMRRSDVGMAREKIIERRTVSFPKSIRDIYDTAENEYVLVAGAKTKTTQWAIVRYTWLRRLCGGFVDGKLIWPGKINLLLELIQGELRHDPVVIWFNFNSELFAVRDALLKAKISSTYILGDLSPAERQMRHKLFQSGKVRVLLLQQAVAQLGMDLSRSDTAIYYSEPVGRLANQQTQDRIINLNKSGPLLIVYLHVESSVDEDVHEVLSGKKIRAGISMYRALQHAMRLRKEGA